MEIKVGLFSDSFPPTIDGVSNVVENYALRIHEKHGCTVVATPYYKEAKDETFPFPVVRYQSIKLKEKLSYRAGNPFDLKSLKRLERENLDIIHVHSPFTSAILAKMLLIGKKKIPIVYTYHTKFNIDFKERIEVPIFRKVATDFIMGNINSSDEVWVVCRGAGDNLREMGYEGGFRVMENGTDFTHKKASPEAIAALRGRHGIGADEAVFLFVGRMMWYKNCRLILNTLRLLKDQGCSFRAFMVGDGYERGEIEAYSDGLGLGDRVVFPGAVQDREELRAYYSTADLFLFPSTFDTSGLVVKEAAACDCPSLLLKGSCAAEGVEDGISGFIASEETAACCADCITRALSHRDTLARTGEIAGKKVYLSWDDAVARAYDRYEAILYDWACSKTLRSGNHR